MGSLLHALPALSPMQHGAPFAVAGGAIYESPPVPRRRRATIYRQRDLAGQKVEGIGVQGLPRAPTRTAYRASAEDPIRTSGRTALRILAGPLITEEELHRPCPRGRWTSTAARCRCAARLGGVEAACSACSATVYNGRGQWRSRTIEGDEPDLAPMQFDVEEVAMPETPAGGFLLDVKACGLCGSVAHAAQRGRRKVTFPWVIGHEVLRCGGRNGAGYDGPWQEGELLSMGPVVYCGHCDFCLEGRYELCENYREIAQA